jgi:uroporphyrinogen decarboxylase
MPTSANKREALLEYLASDQKGGYVPAAFFLHFGPEFQAGQAAIKRHEEFFRFTGMDFVKIQFELAFPKHEVTGSRDWMDVPYLPLSFYEPQLEVVKGLVQALGSEALVVLTLYSPFMIAGRIGGVTNLVEHLQEDPESVFKGLETVTDSLVDFVRECERIGIDGFYHSTQGGESHRFRDPEVFLKWVKPTDHRVMNEINEDRRFNILHVCDYHKDEFGGYDSLAPFLDYPGQVVNVSTDIGGKGMSPTEISKAFGRPYMGGLDRLGVLASGSEDQIRGSVRAVIQEAPAKFILAADCTVPADTPWENLRVAIDEAHGG